MIYFLVLGLVVLFALFGDLGYCVVDRCVWDWLVGCFGDMLLRCCLVVGLGGYPVLLWMGLVLL